MRLHQSHDAACRCLPERCHGTGLSSRSVQVVEQECDDGWLVRVAVVELQGVIVISLPQFLLWRRLVFGGSIQYRWCTNLDGKTKSKATKRNKPVISLASSLGCFGSRSGCRVVQKDSATGLVSVLAARSASPLRSQITFLTQFVDRQGGGVGSRNHVYRHPVRFWWNRRGVVVAGVRLCGVIIHEMSLTPEPAQRPLISVRRE